MRKIFTTIALLGAVVMGANAQRVCDIKIVAIATDSIQINCTDSFQWGYVYVNNGPDDLIAGDTLYFIDHNADSGLVYIAPMDATVSVGDTVVNWVWTDHYDNVIRLVNSEGNAYVYNDPFPNGSYYSPIVFAGFNADSTVIVDNNDSNDVAFPKFIIDCPTGIFNPSKENAEIAIYPNPTSTNINFEYNFDKVAAASVRVLDILGRTVMIQDFGTQNIGNNKFTINVADLPNGLYTLEMTTEGKRAISKFNVSK